MINLSPRFHLPAAKVPLAHDSYPQYSRQGSPSCKAIWMGAQQTIAGAVELCDAAAGSCTAMLDEYSRNPAHASMNVRVHVCMHLSLTCLRPRASEGHSCTRSSLCPWSMPSQRLPLTDSECIISRCVRAASRLLPDKYASRQTCSRALLSCDEVEHIDA